MAELKLRRWDSIKHLKTDDDIKLYIETCVEEAGNYSGFIAKIIDKVDMARKINNISSQQLKVTRPNPR